MTPRLKTRRNGFDDLERRIIACAGSVSVLPDSRLGELCEFWRSPELHHFLVAEVLLRLWLYRRRCPPSLIETGERFAPPELMNAFTKAFLPRRESGGDEDALRASPQFETELAMEAWSFLAHRIRSFRKAHGIIPVRIGSEAVAIPFTLGGRDYPDESIRDQYGRPASGWNEVAGELWDALGGAHRVELGCELGEQGRKGHDLACDLAAADEQRSGIKLCGGSFALPVWLAVQRETKLDFSPIEVLATGAIRRGHVDSVRAIFAKLDLAQRIGVRLFIAPGIASGEGVLGLASPELLENAFSNIATALSNTGLSNLTEERATAQLVELDDKVRRGQISYGDARTAVIRCLDWLSKCQSDELIAEAILRGQMLLGSIETHCGNPERGEQLCHAALKQVRDPDRFLALEVGVSHAVSLCDRGDLEDAEQLGRKLRDQVGTVTNSKLRLVTDMFSAGNLAETLLYRALCEPRSDAAAAESLHLFRESLRINERLLESEGSEQRRYQVAKSATRVALWHALLRPDETASALAGARALIAGFPNAETRVSEQHLRRIQFLGGYRQWLLTGHTAGDFETWPLPEILRADETWVEATARKYRGSLRATIGDNSGADQDFVHALQALTAVNDRPLFRFIGGTAAVQAGESLGATSDEGQHHLQTAAGLFQASELNGWSSGPVRAELWRTRAEGLLSGRNEASLPHPQLSFPY
jgi:hypothetical protein